MEKCFAIYSRKSRFTGKGESIENQIELCRQFIHSSFENVRTDCIAVYEDEGFSGKNLDRPMFKKMMEAARNGCLAAVVVYRLDRISRNVGDFSSLIEEFNRLGISFVSIREQFDTSTPMGRAMMNIASVFAQLERETTAERIRDNMHELAKTGRWLGGITPLGYCSESVSKMSVDGKTHRSCKLKLVQEEAETVKVIFSKFLETNSLTKTDTYLLNNGYRTRRGVWFSRFSIRAILTNPVYMKADEAALRYLSEKEVCLFSEEAEFDGCRGIMAYNRTLQEQGKTSAVKPMEEWIVSVGFHEGLIDGASWVKVQRLLAQNSSKAYRKPRGNAALLSGILFCGECDNYMRPKLTNRVNAQGEQVYTYLCQTKERSRSKLCCCKVISGNSLDKRVLEEIKKLSSDVSFITNLERVGRGALLNYLSGETEIRTLKDRINEKRKEIESLLSALTKAPESTCFYVLDRIEQLHDEIKTMSISVSKLESTLLETEELSFDFDALQQSFTRFSYNVDKMTVGEQRAALRVLINKIAWDGQTVHIYLFGADDTCKCSSDVTDNVQKTADIAKPQCEDSK